MTYLDHQDRPEFFLHLVDNPIIADPQTQVIAPFALQSPNSVRAGGPSESAKITSLAFSRSVGLSLAKLF